MKNGDSLNFDSKKLSMYPFGFHTNQNTLILPFPDQEDSVFVLFHVGMDSIFIQNNLVKAYAEDARYAIININKDNGLGEVMAKNVIFLTDSVIHGWITATRHANGRDWWVIVRKFNKPVYYKVLVHPGGVSVFSVDNFVGILNDDFSQLSGDDCGCSYLFSPDGTKYIQWYYDRRLTIFDFDRCTGTLSNPQVIQIPAVVTFPSPYPPEPGASACFSPDSRFLYLTSWFSLVQLDLTASNILTSMQVIGIIDSTYCTPSDVLPMFMSCLQAAPDGRIYVSSDKCGIHVIHQPNMPGTACNFVQHELIVPGVFTEMMPNHPNYTLGPVAGSICDTLTGYHEQQLSKAGFHITPNPGNGLFRLMTDAPWLKYGFAECRIYDVTGRPVFSQPVNSEIEYIDISSQPDGMYFVKLSNGRRQAGMKVIKNADKF
jgi:hypothetical protein